MRTGFVPFLCLLLSLYDFSIVYGGNDLNMLEEWYSWETVEIKYDDPEMEKKDRECGNYIPENIVILDVGGYEDTVFVTTPSYIPGSPVALSTVSKENGTSGPLLEPFPDWSWQDRSSCDNLIFIPRFKIDELGRLWVMDDGHLNYYTDNKIRHCPPKIVIFDLKNNNKLIKRFVLPEDLVTSESYLINIDVQIMDKSGEETYAYIADAVDSKIYVYNFADDTCMATYHPYYHMNPRDGFFTIDKVPFSLLLGVYGISVDKDHDKLYFQALSSSTQGRVDLELLRKGNLTEDELRQFELFEYEMEARTILEVYVEGILVIATLDDNALYCWDTSTEYSAETIKLMAKDDEKLQFISGLKVVGENLYIASDRLQNIIANEENVKDEVNFRIFHASVSEIVSFCKQSGGGHGHGGGHGDGHGDGHGGGHHCLY